jgi:chromosome partitioning protein
MSKVFAVANQKGGVGKTTTSVNLAASLSATRNKVLLIDLDPQGNATMGSGIDKSSLEYSLYDTLVDDLPFEKARVTAGDAGYDLLPSNGDLVAAEAQLFSMEEREFKLKNLLDKQRSNYDYFIIDCPPSLNMLTINALVAADGVLIPMQCEYYALEGLAALMQTIETIAEHLNPSLHIEGIVRTMYDPRNRLTIEVNRQLFDHFGDTVYRTVIPRNVRLAEAPSFGLPVIKYDKASRGAVSYLALAGEILRRSDQLAAESAAP